MMIKRLALIFILLCCASVDALAQGTVTQPQFRAAEVDGSPDVAVKKFTFPNGTLSNLSGNVTFSLSSGFIISTLGYTPVNKAGDTMLGDLLFTDDTYDIGKSGATRPRNIYASNGIVAGAGHVTVLGGNLQLDNTFGVRIKDSGGTYRTILGTTSGNNVTINTSTLGGSLQFLVNNNAGRIGFFTGSSSPTEMVYVSLGGLLGFGPIASASSNPALKVSGSGLVVRLADDSADSTLGISNLSMSGGVITPSANLIEQRNGTSNQSFRLYTMRRITRGCRFKPAQAILKYLPSAPGPAQSDRFI